MNRMESVSYEIRCRRGASASGSRTHSCLGASLARLEARLTLSRVLERMSDFEIDEAGLRRVRSSTVRGFKALPLEFTPTAPQERRAGSSFALR